MTNEPKTVSAERLAEMLAWAKAQAHESEQDGMYATCEKFGWVEDAILELQSLRAAVESTWAVFGAVDLAETFAQTMPDNWPEVLESRVAAGYLGDTEGTRNLLRATAVHLRQSLRNAPAGSFAVRKLEWEEFHSDDDVLFMHSSGLGTRYEVFHKASDIAQIGIQVVRFEHRKPDTDDYGDDTEIHTILGYGRDLADAYAIAQADYASRITSAIEAVPVSVMPTRERMREKILSDPDNEECEVRPSVPVSVMGEAERLIALITPGNFSHEQQIGDSYGWCERLRAGLTAAIQPDSDREGVIEVRRFDVKPGWDNSKVELIESEAGYWVMHSDHVAALARSLKAGGAE